jgi:hypothetical protein
LPTKPESYFDVLTSAINDLAEHGYDSAERINFWTVRLREAAERSATPPPVMERMLREAMAATYKRMIDQGRIVEFHPGVDRFTLQQVRPHLRDELDRRILAAADLIKLNREQAIQKTLHRFQGWSTSIPKGGSDAVRKSKTKDDIRKSMTSLPFEERRVLIDQCHKLVSSLNDILAKDGGAIAMRWRSNWRQANYAYRPDHKARDGHIYLIRNSWAQQKGFIKPGKDGYLDDITQPAEEISCRCRGVYLYAVSALHPEMITKKGREALEQVRKAA